MNESTLANALSPGGCLTNEEAHELLDLMHALHIRGADAWAQLLERIERRDPARAAELRKAT